MLTSQHRQAFHHVIQIQNKYTNVRIQDRVPRSVCGYEHHALLASLCRLPQSQFLHLQKESCDPCSPSTFLEVQLKHECQTGSATIKQRTQLNGDCKKIFLILKCDTCQRMNSEDMFSEISQIQILYNFIYMRYLE